MALTTDRIKWCYATTVILICMTGGSAAIFCNAHNVYLTELHLTVHEEAN